MVTSPCSVFSPHSKINNRVKQLRTEGLNISQRALGKAIGLSDSGISAIESSSRSVTEKHIKILCLEYNVNEEWLRHGKGEMFNDLSKEEEAAKLVAKALKSNDEFVINTFIALGKLEPKDWDAIKKFVDTIK